jgi:hypothetical protein
MYMIFFCVETGVQRIVEPALGICCGWSMWNDFVQVCYGNAVRRHKLRPLREFSCLEVLTDGFLPTYLLDMETGTDLLALPIGTSSGCCWAEAANSVQTLHMLLSFRYESEENRSFWDVTGCWLVNISRRFETTRMLRMVSNYLPFDMA